MARVPSEKSVEKLLEQSDKVAKKKLESQQRQGKGFVNYGQGVIPEKVWQNLPGKREAK